MLKDNLIKKIFIVQKFEVDSNPIKKELGEGEHIHYCSSGNQVFHILTRDTNLYSEKQIAKVKLVTGAYLEDQYASHFLNELFRQFGYNSNSPLPIEVCIYSSSESTARELQSMFACKFIKKVPGKIEEEVKKILSFIL